MVVSWEELEALGVNWLKLCEITGLDEYARAEGYSGDNINLTIEEFKTLVNKK